MSRKSTVVARQADCNKEKRDEKPMTDRVETAFNIRFVFRPCKNVAEKVCTGDSRHAAQPFSRDGVHHDQGEYAARNRFIGGKLAKLQYQRIKKLVRGAIPNPEKQGDTACNNQHLDQQRMVRGWSHFLLQPTACHWSKTECTYFSRSRGCREKCKNKQAHHIVDHRGAKNHRCFRRV